MRKEEMERGDGTAYRCSVTDGRFYVNIYSDTDLFLKQLRSDSSYTPFIPGWRVEDIFPPETGSVTYKTGSQVRLQYDQPKSTITVTGPIEDFANGRTIAYLSLSLLEKSRQEQGSVLAHAAAVSRDEGGLVLFGERGSGKTSVLLTLCRQFGFKIIGNDLIILGLDPLGGAKIFEGTKVIGLRKAVAMNNFPELLNYFSKDNGDAWTTKAFLSPQELGIETEDNAMPIGYAGFVHIDSLGKQKLRVKREEGPWIRVNLYENFSRYIRGTCLPFIAGEGFDYLGYLPSFDSETAHQNRVDLINNLL